MMTFSVLTYMFTVITFSLCSPNHIHYFTAFAAIGLVGAYSTPVNPLCSESELLYQVEATNCKLIIANSCCLEKARHVANKRNIPIITLGTETAADNVHIVASIGDLLAQNPAGAVDRASFAALQPNVDAEQVLSIPFSSGTTGRPKGVMLTHRNVTTNILQWARSEGDSLRPCATTGRRGALLIPLPFFHIYGLVLGLCGPLYATSKVVFMSQFDLETYLSNLQHQRVTRSYVVPAIVLQLAKSPLVDGFDLSSLPCLLSSAAPLGGAEQEAAAARLKCIVKQGWGMTELSPIGTLPAAFYLTVTYICMYILSRALTLTFP